MNAHTSAGPRLEAAGAATKSDLSWPEPLGPGDAEELYILLHGLDSSERTVRGVRDAIRAERPSSQVVVPSLPFRWDQPRDLFGLCGELLDLIATRLDLGRYRRVRIVGHSAGGVIAQALYLLARTTRVDHPLATLPPGSLRLILIAPINRGWEVSHHLSLTDKITWTLGGLVAPVLTAWNWVRAKLRGEAHEPLWLFQLRRGSPFLTHLRLTWLEVKQAKDWAERELEVVQLLGSVDEIVSWRDMVDTAVGDDFIYLEVPRSDHLGIIDFEDPDLGPGRREVFVAALAPIDELRACPYSIVPWDTDPPPPDPEVKRVVFVIHGIRDEGHWTQKIASRARRAYRRAGLQSRRQIAVVTSSYGFFSLIQFLLGHARRAKVIWLVDLYTEARRRYPSASFSYIGHSNGTFLLAHALRVHPKMRFERIAFAGSVVSSRFDWGGPIGRGQTAQVLNFVANGDWVVGLLPRVSDILPGKLPFGADIGGAGISPFPKQDGVVNRKYRVRDHGTAIEERNWATLAHFAVDAETYPERIEELPPDYADAPKWYLGKRWGPVTTLGFWVFGLVLLLVLLPRLAWLYPQYFLLSALVPLLIGVPVTAQIHGRAAGLEFAERRGIRRRASLILALTLGAIALFWVGGALLAALGFFPSADASEWLRTAAVFVYLMVVWFVLHNV